MPTQLRNLAFLLMALLVAIAAAGTPTMAAPSQPQQETWTDYAQDDARGWILGTAEEVAKIEARPSVQTVEMMGFTKRVFPQSELVIAVANDGIDWRAQADRILAAYPNATPDWRRVIDSLPNDPGQSLQWHLDARGVNLQGFWQSAMPTARRNVNIVVIDSGCNDTHPDLSYAACLFAPSFDDGIDGDGHGTHVAGIIGAISDNSEGIASYAHAYSSNIQLTSCRALDEFGSGWASDVVWCINKATEIGANIVNLSLGGPGNNTLEETALNNFHANGGQSSCASGNDGPDGGKRSPAQYCTYSVGAFDEGGNVATFSNRNNNVYAPGVSIYSTYYYKQGVGSTYAWSSGTSQAAPQIAGMAALRYILTNENAAQIKAKLLGASRQIDGKPAPTVPDLLADIGRDTTPPTVTAKSPANGASNVSVGTNITATFSEAVTGVNSDSVVVSTGGNVAPGSVTYDASTKTVTFNPTSSLEPGKTYDVRIAGDIRDAAGNLLQPVSWSFTTGTGTQISVFVPLARR